MITLQNSSLETQRKLVIDETTGELEGKTASDALIGGVLFGVEGASTGTGAEEIIPHGLGIAPDFVVITPTATGQVDAFESSAADATNIYLTCTLDVPYKFLAIKIG